MFSWVTTQIGEVMDWRSFRSSFPSRLTPASVLTLRQADYQWRFVIFSILRGAISPSCLSSSWSPCLLLQSAAK